MVNKQRQTCILDKVKCAGLTLLPLFLLVLFFSGCRPAPFFGPVPKGTQLLPLTLFDRGTVVAWHPSGESFSASKNGLIRYDIRTGQSRLIDREEPNRLVWSPEGSQLAIAYQAAESTRIVLRDSGGKLLAETTLAGVPDRLLWSKEAGLLIITAELKSYSFGSDLTLNLTRWDGIKPPQTTVLYNATIKPSTSLDWKQEGIAKSEATLSPDQDEMLYLQLRDPPAFQGSYRLTLRHLETGAEKEIAPLPIGRRSAQFIDSDRVLIDNGDAGSLVLHLWNDEPPLPLSYSGAIIAVSPAGHYWVIGDRLLQDGEMIGRFSGLTAADFSPDGSRLLLRINARWHLLEGLREAVRPAISSADADKLRQLRNWRSRGLITPEEYQNQKTGILQP